jgi:membrane peptidoglycan carboxypeptidase
LRVGLIMGLIVAVLGAPFAALLGRPVRAGSEAFLELPLELAESQAGRTSDVSAADGTTLITHFYEEYRRPLSNSELGEILPAAVVAAEDTRFYEHHGVDVKSLVLRDGIQGQPRADFSYP